MKEFLNTIQRKKEFLKIFKFFRNIRILSGHHYILEDLVQFKISKLLNDLNIKYDEIIKNNIDKQNVFILKHNLIFLENFQEFNSNKNVSA